MLADGRRTTVILINYLVKQKVKVIFIIMKCAFKEHSVKNLDPNALGSSIKVHFLYSFQVWGKTYRISTVRSQFKFITAVCSVFNSNSLRNQQWWVQVLGGTEYPHIPLRRPKVLGIEHSLQVFPHQETGLYPYSMSLLDYFLWIILTDGVCMRVSYKPKSQLD